MALLAVRPTLHAADWSDRELLARVLRREERAWNEMVRRYRALIYRCITKVTGKYSLYASNADVDEVFAEVLLALLRDDMHKLRMYDPTRGTKLGSWIGIIAVNAAFDYLRSAIRRPAGDRLDPSYDPHEPYDRTPLDMLLDKERWASLNDVLAEFSEKDRQFLDLFYARGMGAEEVAAEMKISLKTVYSKNHKIRTHLRRCIERLQAMSAIADLAPA
ncbi:MAG TPA: sigma-70 family RNA polymerase sigma factor [Kofleriaceae bacterium]|jgi:RNA polymerase sigma-70 factor (ECF subfamily)|nr:sigma-70 family RNA polymerase sigma factor [Kofleriaceae bacterium]